MYKVYIIKCIYIYIYIYLYIYTYIESYITIKDHKDDFSHKISCRLINPSESDIGKISKVIIDKINTKLLEKYLKETHGKTLNL